MKMLVLGGSRFIGLNPVRLLHDRGHDAVARGQGHSPSFLSFR